MQTTTSRLTSGTEQDTEFASWRTADIESYLACQRALLARKGELRIRTRKGRLEVIALRDELQAELDRRANETVEARQLRDGDVIVNSAGDEIPVLLAGPHNGLIIIWTSRTNCFAMSPSLRVNIKRRGGSQPHDIVGLAAETGISVSAAAGYVEDLTDHFGSHRVIAERDHETHNHTLTAEGADMLRELATAAKKLAKAGAVREPGTYEDPAVRDAIFDVISKAGA